MDKPLGRAQSRVKPLTNAEGAAMNAQTEGFLVQSMKHQIDISVRMAEACAAYWRGVSEAMARTPPGPVSVPAKRKNGRKSAG